MMDWGNFHFAVKIDFQCESGRIKNCSAIITGAQMALNFAGYLRHEAALHILTD